MNLPRQRPVPWMLTLGLLCLSVAVFTWVLQYKMSLYHVERSTPAPAAKLWMGPSGNTGRDIKAAPSRQSPVVVPAIFLILYFSFLITFYAPILRNWRQVDFVWKIQILSFLTAFSFRPPPAFI